jgi:hypothetical protein
MGEVSKLSLMKGEASMSGEVKLVNAADGGAEPKSVKMSLGEMVRCEPDATEGSLIAVKAATPSKEKPPAWKAGIRLAPESNELLLCRSAMFATFDSGCWMCGIELLLELWNNGTGGRCRDKDCCWNSVVDDGAEFA